MKSVIVSTDESIDMMASKLRAKDFTEPEETFHNGDDRIGFAPSDIRARWSAAKNELQKLEGKRKEEEGKLPEKCLLSDELNRKFDPMEPQPMREYLIERLKVETVQRNLGIEMVLSAGTTYQIYRVSNKEVAVVFLKDWDVVLREVPNAILRGQQL